MTWRLLFAAALAVAATAGSCGGDTTENDDANTEATPASSSPAAAGTAATATATALPSHPLMGDWETSLAADDPVRLSLRAAGYTIRRGPDSGTGAVRVSAAEIEFYGSSLCDGTGRYRWTLERDTLSFTMVDDDPCGGRSEVLDGVSYTR